MDNTQVALLRGINVGTAKRVAMEDLRALVEELGFTDVRTLLNSGNVVFSGPKAEPRQTAERIKKALEAKLGVSASVIVISAQELSEIVEANPLAKIADNSSRLLVGILSDPADQARLAEIAKQDWGAERIVLGADLPGGKASGKGGVARAVYMWMPMGVIASKVNAAVGKALGDGITSRNWATILKLKEMAEKGGV